jgi:hypothetical protein
MKFHEYSLVNVRTDMAKPTGEFSQFLVPNTPKNLMKS